MIGLKRDTVKLVPYSREWPISFEKEKKKLQKVFGDSAIDIQHIGSTAVPGLTAKPLVDIAVGLKRLKDIKKFKKQLELIGYSYGWTFHKKIFFMKGIPARRTHCIHVIRCPGPQWDAVLNFRNALRANKNTKKAYRALKKRLAADFPNDRDRYTREKHAFITRVLQKIST